MKKPAVRLAAALLAVMLLAGCAGAKETAGSSDTGSTVPASGAMTPLHSLTTFWASGPEGAYVTVSRPEYGWNILCIDYATRTGVPLCSQANCAHDSDGCTAWLAKNTNCYLFYWQDKLYILTSASTEAPSALWEAEPNGQNRRKLLELESYQAVAAPILASGRQLYFSLMEFRDGDDRQLLCRFDLDEGKLTLLYNCLEAESDLLGGWDGWLLLEMTDPVNPDVPNDLAHVEEYTAALQARTHSLYRVSTGGDREEEPLFTWEGDGAVAGGYGSLFYLLDTRAGALTVRDLAAGTERTVQDDRLRTDQYTDLYIPVAEGALVPIQPEDMRQYPTWYLYHEGRLTASRYQYVGGNVLDAPRNRIVADAGDWYLVERSFDRPNYALVPKADYWADSDGATDIPIQIEPLW